VAHRTSTEARSSHARPLEPARAEDEHRQVARAQRDPLAFAPLYQRYVRSIYAYCFQRLGSHEAAEDATSQVFLKALAALPRYRSESFRAWLFTIAHNVVMDAHRQRPAAPLDQAGEIADHRQSPEEAVILVDGRRSVRRLLERLTPDQRDVVALRLEGLPTGEIAQVLGRRPGAIRATQLRGYRRLRDLLESEVQL
jgi:RNA polymerase sigma-70 factor (ECF subfamily)